ncbi:Hypothetical predicted protein [Cloeon dipterum]|uniref:Peptide-N(4)-(N-acetyl-beta-glucosaminyl)asparagine amidase n=1 Tax=Cloeon dipterum TaxID=197152 RepID=A0A8S1CM57_9INSE|nr:Hypothetical predicted protein [Cloeon dipterum]
MQAKARRVVPVEELWIRAQKTLRDHQSEKVGVEEAEDKGLPDLLLYELLQWFKYEFFSWVDQPDCIQCKAKTSPVGMSKKPEHLKEAGRTELFVCPSGHETPFHRYNNPAKLLQTRRGRCGEWANCFTLICRALDMDARLVHDETDHVWTEVWSVTQQRWIHCDACEAIMDSPFTYQAGWGKKLNYVIAFSRDDVQDVTWKYTQEPVKVVMDRRNLCTEEQLQNLLNVLRYRLQEKVSPARKAFLQNRQINELMAMISVPGSHRVLKNTETQGRISGSDEWRRNRKETGQINSNWVWKPNAQELEAGRMQIKFSAAQNLYVKGTEEKMSGWASGVMSASNIARKVERDWKMVYLARTEGAVSDDGSIVWRIEVPKSHKIGGVELTLPAATFDSGKIRWKICGENPDLCFMVPLGQTTFKTRELAGCSAITIKADLTGGSGTCAWQHTQISRQLENDSEFPLQFDVELI